MKKICVAFFLVSIYTNCTSQTKADTYQHLNEKIDIYKLDDIKKNYNYLLEEVDINHNKTIKFIQFCTAYKLCSTAYYLNANEYSKMTVKEKAGSKIIEIFFTPNSLETQKINIKTEEHFKGKTASSITISLEKDTPNSEVTVIKKRFIDLLKIYRTK